MSMLFDWPGLSATNHRSKSGNLVSRVADLVQHDRRARDLRLKIFDSRVINDPCWHILQDLFAAHLSGETVQPKHLYSSTALPASTVMRYLDHLEVFGAVSRQDDPNDCGVTLVSLTTAGLRWMHEYYEQMASDSTGRLMCRSDGMMF